jgi:hypothetical protein
MIGNSAHPAGSLGKMLHQLCEQAKWPRSGFCCGCSRPLLARLGSGDQLQKRPVIGVQRSRYARREFFLFVTLNCRQHSPFDHLVGQRASSEPEIARIALAVSEPPEILLIEFASALSASPLGAWVATPSVPALTIASC